MASLLLLERVVSQKCHCDRSKDANTLTATVTGTQFTVVDTSGTTYLVYSLSSITLTAKSESSNSGSIRAGGEFNGVLRFVMLAKEEHKELLDKHYETYPAAANVDYSFTDTTGDLIFNWETVGDGANLLMLTWPHHRLSMENANFPSTDSLAYLTTKLLSPESSNFRDGAK